MTAVTIELGFNRLPLSSYQYIDVTNPKYLEDLSEDLNQGIASISSGDDDQMTLIMRQPTSRNKSVSKCHNPEV